jgi:hypothetical protein
MDFASKVEESSSVAFKLRKYKESLTDFREYCFICWKENLVEQNSFRSLLLGFSLLGAKCSRIVIMFSEFT